MNSTMKKDQINKLAILFFFSEKINPASLKKWKVFLLNVLSFSLRTLDITASSFFPSLHLYRKT